MLAGLIFIAGGCRKEEAPEEDLTPVKTVVAGQKLIDFDEQTGAFSCLAPADWKAMEDAAHIGPMLMFFGPMEGPLRGKTSIGISHYPDAADPFKTPQDLWDSAKIMDQKPSPLEKRMFGTQETYVFHRESPHRAPESRKTLYMDREDTAMISFKDGFFEITHSAPADSYKDTLPVFEALVESFQPKR
ncbi:MAG: hypothetical protein A2506_04645 [Elusimicrobia bacterium RIFOXYD12_FULL_66_9]|nr:MAG: hypothetical protein A2506_04645 [Elusimicrobia bacterium RIFOXYD12_FULL_66_9]